jgi:hypothetical protein
MTIIIISITVLYPVTPKGKGKAFISLSEKESLLKVFQDFGFSERLKVLPGQR